MSTAFAAHSLARCNFFAVLALALDTAHGLRSRPLPAADGAGVDGCTDGRFDALLGDLQAEAWHQRSDDGPRARAETEDSVRKVPDIGNFSERWRNFSARGLHGSTRPNLTLAPFRPRPLARTGNQKRKQAPVVLMVVGIFTTRSSQDEPFREVIRSTWMTQPGVCRLKEIRRPPLECFLFATFVVGIPGFVANANGVELQERCQHDVEADLRGPNETDLLVVNASEDINCGKTRSWFEYASQQYTMATHIGKMDMDAFLDTRRFEALLQDFHPKAICPYVYGGRPWHCHNDLCPPLHCGRPKGTDFREYSVGDPACWTYMQGGFYYMSRALAQATSVPGGFWNFAGEISGDCLPEDVLAGSAINNWARETGSCVSVLNMAGQEAIWHADTYRTWSTADPNSFPE